MKKFFLLITMVMSAMPCMLFADSGFIQAEFGRSNVDFEPEYIVGSDYEYDDSGSIHVHGGYEFSSGFIVAATADMMGNVTLFGSGDNFQFYQAGVLLGFAIPVAKHFRITPAVGAAVWELDAKEGRFLNPGPEEELEENGTQAYWKLSFEFPINERFQLNTSYTNNTYEFGDVKTVRFGFRFNFNAQ